MRNILLLAFVASCAPPPADGPTDGTTHTPDTPSGVYNDDDSPAPSDVVDDTPVETDGCWGVKDGCGSDTADSDVPTDTDTPDTDIPTDTDTDVPVETGVLYCPDIAPGDECYCDSHPSDPWCNPQDTDTLDTDIPVDTDSPDTDTLDTDVPADTEVPVDTEPPTFEELCPPPSDQYEWYRGITPDDMVCLCGYYPGNPACVCPTRPPDDPWCWAEGWPW